MCDQEDSRFEIPPTDAVLWRYMSFTKFVSLLTTNALFFARADKLGGPFEGALSPVNVAIHPYLYAIRSYLYKDGLPEDQQNLLLEKLTMLTTK